MAQPPQQPPYLDWPLDRWKIGIAVLLFLSLAAWRFVDFGTTGSSDGEVLTTASPAVRIANPGALADPTSTPTPDNSTGPAAETVTITETIVVERTVTADTPVAGEEPVDSAEQLPAEATAEPESTETTSPAEIPAPTEPGTDTPTATMTVTVAPTETATPTLTPTPSPSPSPTPTPTPSPTPQPLTLSVIGESDIFLQNSRPLLYGKAPAGAAVSLEIDAARYTVEADDEGHWQFVPPAPLPVGMNWVRASLSGVATTATDGAVSQMLRIASTARAVDSPLLMSMLVDEALLTNTPVLSGSGPPGWLIYLEREDAADEEREFLGVTVIDLNGRWSWQPERPLPSGEHRIRAVVVDAEGTPLAISQPQRVRIAGNARPLRPPEMIPLFALDAAEATAAGELLIEGLMGTATPSAQLLLYVDGEWIETIRTSDSGEWRYTFSEPIPGRAHDVRLVEVDSNGSPLTLSGPLVLPLQGYEQDSPAP